MTPSETNSIGEIGCFGTHKLLSLLHPAFPQLRFRHAELRTLRMLIRCFAAIFSLLSVCGLSSPVGQEKLPRRLVLCLDGVSWRDVKALQEGAAADPQNRSSHLSAFDHGYYPVSRLVSTFPSSSDVAWTEILA